jgi:uncharacterized protein
MSSVTDAVGAPPAQDHQPGEERHARGEDVHGARNLLWSRYNVLYQSPRFGPFLYNALSNALLDLDDEHFRRLTEMCGRGGAEVPVAPPGGGSAGDDQDFLAVLQEHKVLVGEGADEAALLALHYDRLGRCFDTAVLSLTICPTLGCDFRCTYCFEDSQADGAVMDAGTIDALIAFIESFRDVRRLTITWYGGEPTLAWAVIEEVTRRVEELDVEFQGATLVTNGYGLDAAKIARLSDLKISQVQITLDGPAEVHDVRRPLAGGAPTFARILANVHAVAGSDYEGRCSIRVNADRDNASRVAEVPGLLAGTTADGKVRVYATRVTGDPARGDGRLLPNDEWAALETRLHRDEGVCPPSGLYPVPQVGTCDATGRNSFVVGPRGELYECWDVVGRPEWVTGHLSSGAGATRAQCVEYAVSLDPFNDDLCGACTVLPVCGGGCVHQRLLARRAGTLQCTSPLRDHLAEYLDEYYDDWLARALCTVGLPLDEESRRRAGYRAVHPAALKAAAQDATT